MSRQQLLTDWVKLKHQGQFIRKTDEPYFNHLLFVANTVAGKTQFGYEVGLCHDLLEDTDTNAAELSETLIFFGYDDVETAIIVAEVIELTDQFTKTAFPELKKADRKAREAMRLATISPAAQTVKYADLLYNIGWVMSYDLKNAAAYLEKKRLLLTNMNLGDNSLRRQAIDLIINSLAIINGGIG